MSILSAKNSFKHLKISRFLIKTNNLQFVYTPERKRLFGFGSEENGTAI